MCYFVLQNKYVRINYFDDIENISVFRDLLVRSRCPKNTILAAEQLSNFNFPYVTTKSLILKRRTIVKKKKKFDVTEGI